jgi:lipopolysaccharide transport system permease protein
MTIILCTVFSQILLADVKEYGPFLMAGLACWNFVFTSTLVGCQCFHMGESYIRQYPAPMAIYPLRTVLGGLVHFLLALSVVILLTWYLKGLSNIQALIFLVPAIVLLFLFAWSLAVLAGFANVFFQDTQHLAEVGFQLLFYTTPIIYMEHVLEQNRIGWLLQFNPLVAFLRLFREPILLAHPPSLETYATACTVVLIAVGAAVGVLVGCQRRLIFYL